MHRDILIGDTSVPMTANAATDYRLKQVFKVDPIRELQKQQTADDNTEGIRLAMMLAYVMSRQAMGKKALAKMSEDDYLEWLEDFMTVDLVDAAGAVLELYQGQKVPDVQEKKLDEEQTDH